jgi:hypothetical protein
MRISNVEQEISNDHKGGEFFDIPCSMFDISLTLSAGTLVQEPPFHLNAAAVLVSILGESGAISCDPPRVPALYPAQ